MKNSAARFFFYLLILLQCTSVYADSVFHKRLNYQIIIPDNPTEVQKFAASELKYFLDLTYSAPLSLNGKTDSIIFMVGFPESAIMAGFTDVPAMRGRFGVFRKNSTFLFFGEDYKNLDPVKTPNYNAGTLSAVYYFLIKYAGTGFYLPGDKGYSITPNCPIVFDKAMDIPAPTFECRGFSTAAKEFSGQEMNIFFRRSLCHIPFWGKPDLAYYFIEKWKKRFWSTHPEYFMIRDGKRINESYPFHVPCFSNPDVVRQAAADIVGEINRNPALEVVRMFCDAPVKLCQCARCAASKERGMTGQDIEICEEFYGFQKKVMDLVHEAYPQIYFMSQTKGDSYRNPPKLVNPGPQFTIEILTQYPDVNADNSEFVELAKAWNAAGARTILKSYPRWPDYKDYPIINPKFTQKYFKAFAGVAKGTYYSDLRINSLYSFSACGQFIQAKVLFDVNADVDRLTAEFCAFAYPGAEQEMVAFYQEMERLYMDKKEFRRNPLEDIYYADKLQKAKSLLDDASNKVKKDSVWFARLQTDFNKFYNESLAAKPEIDTLFNAAPQKTLNIPLLKNTIKVDGSVSPAEWAEALKEIFYPNKKYKDFQQSEAFIGCDSKNLFIGLNAFEKQPDRLLQKCRINHAGRIWNDDCFEIMLVNNQKKRAYYQIVVNSQGTYQVMYRENNKPSVAVDNFRIEVKAQIVNDRWSVEMQIPLEQFKSSDFQDLWQINIFRSRILNDPIQEAANRQSSGLRIFSYSYHCLEQYHYLKWPDEAVPRNIFLDWLLFRQN
jgi:hypothetical protein